MAREGADDCGEVDDANDLRRVDDMNVFGSIGIGLSGCDVTVDGHTVCRWVAMLKECTECLRMAKGAREVSEIVVHTSNSPVQQLHDSRATNRGP